VTASAKRGAGREDSRVPELVGGILKDDCDHAFWCAFSIFRTKEYEDAMRMNNELDYIKERNDRFPCTKQ
jgi:hypothetical protein